MHFDFRVSEQENRHASLSDFILGGPEDRHECSQIRFLKGVEDRHIIFSLLIFSKEQKRTRKHDILAGVHLVKKNKDVVDDGGR
jgi:hypothetical protein